MKRPNSRLILRAVELSSAGLQTWIGTFVGIAGAVAVGLFFFKGTLRVPLHRFFAVTSVILMLVAFQLAITGLHELSEAQWLPSSKTEMAIIGSSGAQRIIFLRLDFWRRGIADCSRVAKCLFKMLRSGHW